MTLSPTFDGPRLIRPEELRAVERLAKICFNLSRETTPEDGNESSDPAEYYQDGETYIIAADGKPVSQIGTFQERIHAFDGLIQAGCIGGVCTYPDYRGHGLATQLMEYCTQRLVEGGARLMVISGGRGLYTRLGSVRVGRYANFTIHPRQAVRTSHKITLRPVIKQNETIDAMLCSRLYAAEAVRFQRPMEYFLDHFQNLEPGYNQEEWIVEVNGQPEAYIFLITDWQYVGQPEIGQRRVYEYAGSRVALAAAIPAVVEQAGINLLEVGIPWQDADLQQMLIGIGYHPQWAALDGHTMRIINFPGLLYDLEAYIQSRLSPELRRGLRFEQTGPLLGVNGDDRYAIVHGRERLELNGAQMTALVMGSPEEDDPPLPGALAEIIPALFPLPSFLPGINYH
jgi:GNAT superfamily N-acetyltransferase